MIKKNKKDWIATIIIIIMLLCVVVLGFYYYDKRINECTSNPLVFGAKMLEEQYNEEFYGTFFFLTPSTPHWSFNSKNITMTDYPEQ